MSSLAAHQSPLPNSFTNADRPVLPQGKQRKSSPTMVIEQNVTGLMLRTAITSLSNRTKADPLFVEAARNPALAKHVRIYVHIEVLTEPNKTLVQTLMANGASTKNIAKLTDLPIEHIEAVKPPSYVRPYDPNQRKLTDKNHASVAVAFLAALKRTNYTNSLLSIAGQFDVTIDELLFDHAFRLEDNITRVKGKQ